MGNGNMLAVLVKLAEEGPQIIADIQKARAELSSNDTSIEKAKQVLTDLEALITAIASAL